jgi:hypothetical protein
MEEICPYETLVSTYKTTRPFLPVGWDLQSLQLCGLFELFFPSVTLSLGNENGLESTFIRLSYCEADTALQMTSERQPA